MHKWEGLVQTPADVLQVMVNQDSAGLRRFDVYEVVFVLLCVFHFVMLCNP